MSRWWLVVGAAMGALVWLGAPAWPQQLDDQLITLAFAHEWAETGVLRWSGGAVVEACSSFLQLTLATAWIALIGADANVFVKALAAVCGVALVAFAGARVPRSLGGALLLAALVTWEPLAWWSFAGMETTLFALLLTVGWAGVLVPRAASATPASATPASATAAAAAAAGAPVGPALGPAAGLGALWLAATAHPEGNLHFAVAAALVAWRGARRERRAAALLVGALAAWHALRVAWFGHLLPTPWLVKMAGNDPFGDQWGQWGWDLVTLAGVGATLLVAFPARWRALLPFVVQCLVEVRAEADWMGHGRHLLPGVCATAVAWAAGSTPRALGRGTALALIGLIGLSALFEPPAASHGGLRLRDARALSSPARWFRAALDTTQLEDVVWIVENAPWGGRVMLEDVGMPGNVEGVGVVDLVGLTDRDIALAWVGDEAADERLRARFAGPEPLALVRRMRYGEESFVRPVPWVRLPAASKVLYPQGTALRYELDPTRPTPEQVRARWAALHARYPSQGPLAWHYALAEARAGHLVAAARIATAAARRAPADPMLRALPRSLYATFGIERFDEAPSALRQVSRDLPRTEAAGLALRLDVQPAPDAGQLVTVRWGCDGPVATVLVDGPTVLPLPAWACPGDTARLRVEALDGRPKRPLPRVLDVGLTTIE